MSELRNCPWCGGKPFVWDYSPRYVECSSTSCRANGPLHVYEAEAIAAWNSLCDRLAKVAELEAACAGMRLMFLRFAEDCGCDGESMLGGHANVAAALLAKLKAADELAGLLEDTKGAIFSPHNPLLKQIDSALAAYRGATNG